MTAAASATLQRALEARQLLELRASGELGAALAALALPGEDDRPPAPPAFPRPGASRRVNPRTTP